MKIRTATLASLAVLGLSGCATIVKGSSQELTISSSVPDARYEVRNNRTNALQGAGQTPATVTLPRGAGYFKSASYTVTVSKDGYAPMIFPVEAHTNGWYWGGNLLIGGLIGYLALDPASGAMWTLEPPSIVAKPMALAGASITTPVSAEAAVPAPVRRPAAPLEVASAAATPVADPPPAAALPGVPSPALEAGGQARLKGGGVVRSRPLVTGEAKEVASGTLLQLKSDVRNAGGHWWYVSGEGQGGWVLASDLDPAS